MVLRRSGRRSTIDSDTGIVPLVLSSGHQWPTVLELCKGVMIRGVIFRVAFTTRNRGPTRAPLYGSAAVLARFGSSGVFPSFSASETPCCSIGAVERTTVSKVLLGGGGCV